MARLIALSLATAAAVAVPAFADTSLAGDISIDTTAMQSSTTRAEVRAAIDRAPDSEWTRQRADLFGKSGYTRAEARSDYLKSRSETSRMTAEDSGSMYLNQEAATRAMGAGPMRR